MPVLAFARDNPRYDTLWLFENDLAFTGPLSSLIEAFVGWQADLLSTIAPPPNDWVHLSMKPSPRAGRRTWTPLRTFLPAFRASRRLPSKVDRFYCEGGNGHYEYIWATVALAKGPVLEDLGGNGRYVRPGNATASTPARPRPPTSIPARSGSARPGDRRDGGRRRSGTRSRRRSAQAS